MTQHYLETTNVVGWSVISPGFDGMQYRSEDGSSERVVPKKEFDKNHIPMGQIGQLSPLEVRIVAEYVQLRERAAKLLHFLEQQESRQTLDDDALDLLEEQSIYMELYKETLEQRMDALGTFTRWVQP